MPTALPHSVVSRRRFLQASAAVSALWLTRAGELPVWALDEAATVAKQLQVHTEVPHNAEPKLANLVHSRITPLAQFYVRSHGPTPQLNAADYRLSVEGLIHKPLTLSLDQVNEKFKKHTVEATLTCAGNRRSEMSAVKAINGVQWKEGAIGNANWGGASLAELLRAAEIKEGAKHVWFEGLDSIKDKDGSVAPFGGSIPLEKALEMGDTPGGLLAYEMNEKPLAADHGFPLRTLIPGYIGARSVKWLGKIVVSDRPSPNHYLAEAYKLITSDDKAELAAAAPLYPFPINAAICVPASGARLKAGKTTVTGYALPSGQPGAIIDKVELSLDGGKTWQPTHLETAAKAATWRLWSLDVDLTPSVKELTLRATDNRGHSQPETTPWNFKGYMHNAWHRIKVDVAG